VEQPLRPLEKTVAVLNMDIIGRNEEVPEAARARFKGLNVQTAASNALAISAAGCAAAFIHTRLHPDYHSAFDRPERMAITARSSELRLVYLCKRESGARRLAPQPWSVQGSSGGSVKLSFA
jgi:hypothetical protein